MRNYSICLGDEVDCCFSLDGGSGTDRDIDDVEVDTQGGGYASDRINEVDCCVELEEELLGQESEGGWSDSGGRKSQTDY